MVIFNIRSSNSHPRRRLVDRSGVLRLRLVVSVTGLGVPWLVMLVVSVLTDGQDNHDN